MAVSSFQTTFPSLMPSDISTAKCFREQRICLADQSRAAIFNTSGVRMKHADKEMIESRIIQISSSTRRIERHLFSTGVQFGVPQRATNFLTKSSHRGAPPVEENLTASESFTTSPEGMLLKDPGKVSEDNAGSERVLLKDPETSAEARSSARQRKAHRRALQKQEAARRDSGTDASTSGQEAAEPSWKARIEGRGQGALSEEREYLDMGKRVRSINGEAELIYAEDYDLAVDVRSPGEFEEDHLIGALNCPVLDNEERATVGTIYKQESPFKARRIGAAMVAKNIARIFEDHFLDLDKDKRILVYCWRGGERSGSFAHTVSRVGWPTFIIKGGYKTYRAQVRAFMDSLGTWPIHVISGKTGSGKGLMLDALRRHGAQVLDLEAAANHRGSILGDAPGGEGQPSQKLMESRIFHQMRGFTPQRVTFVEGESSLLGKLKIPKPLVHTMRQTTHTQVHVPMEWRVKHTSEGYTHFAGEAGHSNLKSKLDYLRPLRGHKMVDRWFQMIDAGLGPEFCEDILREHYDPAYLHSFSRDRIGGETINVEIPDLKEGTLDAFARDLIEKYDPAGAGRSAEESGLDN